MSICQEYKTAHDEGVLICLSIFVMTYPQLVERLVMWYGNSQVHTVNRGNHEVISRCTWFIRIVYIIIHPGVVKIVIELKNNKQDRKT